jgi:phage-related protein
LHCPSQTIDCRQLLAMPVPDMLRSIESAAHVVIDDAAIPLIKRIAEELSRQPSTGDGVYRKVASSLHMLMTQIGTFATTDPPTNAQQLLLELMDAAPAWFTVSREVVRHIITAIVDVACRSDAIVSSTKFIRQVFSASAHQVIAETRSLITEAIIHHLPPQRRHQVVRYFLDHPRPSEVCCFAFMLRLGRNIDRLVLR